MRKVNSSIPSLAILMLFILGSMQNGFAQKPAKTNIFPSTGSAGIGTITPHSSSLLEMKSTTQGFLPPRMLKQNMLDIVGPDRGLLVFVTDGEAPGYYYNNGVNSSDWVPVRQIGSSSGANQALSNLSTTEINTHLLPKSAGTSDLGSLGSYWRKAYVGEIKTATIEVANLYTGVLLANNSDGGTVISGRNQASGTGIFASSVSGEGIGCRSDFGIGIIAYSENNTGIMGIVGPDFVADRYAGYFAGNVFSTGTYQGSDKKLKQKILDLSNAMGIINKLHPTQYEFRQDGNYKLMNLPKGNHYGLIAQEVEEVLPGLIKETTFDPNVVRQIKGGYDENTKKTVLNKDEEINFKAVNYTELIPIMIKGMQELSKTNEEKDAAIKDLQKQIDELKQLIKSNSATTNIKIQNSSEIVELKSISVLEQNTPNPFTNNTAIHYSLPDNKGNAFINFYSSAGVVLKSVKLNASGKGVIDLKASELASGIYQYSLLIDGKVIETKQMIRLK